jgi:hypothetical protein
MTLVLEWTCDGCGAKHRAVGLSAKAPVNWAAPVKIGLYGLTNWRVKPPEEATFDLCAHCQITLIEKINPRDWPRPVPPMMPGEVA